jgi:hypothetical protein
MKSEIRVDFKETLKYFLKPQFVVEGYGELYHDTRSTPGISLLIYLASFPRKWFETLSTYDWTSL